MDTLLHTILIPVDFSAGGEPAIEYGAYLASKFKADIVLLHVIEGTHNYPQGWFSSESPDTFKFLVRKKASGVLNEYAGSITKKYKVKVKSALATGKPAAKIAETVAGENIDLIVMGTHGTNGFEELFMGSTSHKVVNLSPCPVITVREGFNVSEIRSIVLPIDDSLYSREKINHVLPIASKCHSVVHILGITKDGDKLNMNKFNSKITTVEKAVKNAGVKFERKVVTANNVAIEAMNYAAEVNADLLAIMTDHESDMPGAFMGAFAHQIVNHSIVPVLSIKPHKTFYDYPV